MPRWAIKVASPTGLPGKHWGDTIFAEDLAAAVRRRGISVRIARRDDWPPRLTRKDDVAIVLRGLRRVPVDPEALNILWIISHPELVTDDELNDFDLVFASSRSWADKTSKRINRPIGILLQATDPYRFRPELKQMRLERDMIFVGSTRQTVRPLVKWADESADGSLSVFGPGWEGLIAPEHHAALFLDAKDVGRRYASARIVLNDLWPEMAESGFISNRVFDAVASGAWVISDPVEGIDDVFGGVVSTVATQDEFDRLLRGPTQHPSEAARLAAADEIRKHHSFDMRVIDLLCAVDASVGGVQPSQGTIRPTRRSVGR